MKPHISVLMSVYNGELYLQDAVKSIINQTFSDFEFIIVDDGSNDKTKKILDGYKDPRIVCLNNEKTIGLVKSLNRGLSMACGELIARMDADDVSHPKRLEKQVVYLEAHPEVGVLGSWINQVDEGGNYLTTYQVPIVHEMIVWKMLYECAIAHASVVMRRALLVDAGGYDPSFLHIEDTELWSRLVHLTRFANLPETLYARRIHKDSICSLYGDRQYEVGMVIRHRLFSDLLGGSVDREVVEWLSMALHSKAILNRTQTDHVIVLLSKAYAAFVKQQELRPKMAREIQADLVKRFAAVDRHINWTVLSATPFMLSETAQVVNSICEASQVVMEMESLDRQHLTGLRRALAAQMLRLIWVGHHDRIQMLRAYVFVMSLSAMSVVSLLGFKVFFGILVGHRLIGVMKHMRHRFLATGLLAK